LLDLSTQQNQKINDFCNSYLCNNSSQRFQNNQNFNSLQTSDDFDYNLGQYNFELQNKFQNQNGNVNHFLNEFSNGNNFKSGATDNFCS